MEISYKILYQGGVGEVVEKKSRFLATVIPAHSEDVVKKSLETIRKKYWDASHNCYAYIIGEKGMEQKCSDDGEPSGTAGRPILEVLLGEGVRDLLVVVTRYFGGTLLGTGGLVNAYTNAAKEGLRNSQVLEKCLGKKIRVQMDYNGIGKLKYVTGQTGITILEESYTETALFDLIVPINEVEGFREKLLEMTSAKVGVEDKEDIWFGKLNKELIILEDSSGRILGQNGDVIGKGSD